jgi:holo-[acyl-carrier protein] synthase
MIYTGIDIVQHSEIRHSIVKYGENFLRKIYSSIEIYECNNSSNNIIAYAERFALKEAFMKALGTGLTKGVSWKQIEYASQSIRLYGKVELLINANKVKNIKFSFTSSSSLSVAIVLLS